MTREQKAWFRGQEGYTLIELLIASAIGAIVLGALTSVILTSVRINDVASSRLEASAQLRNFQLNAYDDFSRAQVQGGAGCVASSPCTTVPIVLSGTQVSNAFPPVAGPYQVTYAWDGSDIVDRTVSTTGAPVHAATNVTAFSWYVDTSGVTPIVVVNMTVTVNSYSQTQTLQFAQRLNP